MTRSLYRVVSVALMLALHLAGCATRPSLIASPTVALPSGGVAATPAPAESRNVAPTLDPGGQYATDPTTVTLASGKPTLVKFFAFW